MCKKSHSKARAAENTRGFIREHDYNNTINMALKLKCILLVRFYNKEKERERKRKKTKREMH